MWNVWLMLWSFICIVSATVPPQRDWMDDYETCSYKSTIFVKDGRSYLIHARQTRDHDPPDIYSCEVIIGPFDEHRSLNVDFRLFYIQTCKVTFTITQGRSSTMLEERSLKKFDCNTKGKARDQSFKLSQENVYLRLHLKRSDPSDLNFNFVLNITSVPVKSEETGGGISIGVKIGIAILSVVAFIMIVFFVYKTVRMKMSMDDEVQESDNGINLYNHSGSNHSNLNSYMPMPQKDTVRQIRTPDPDIYFEFNPSQSQNLIENGTTNPKTPPPLPPPYEEAVQQCLPLSEVEQQYGVEYVNVQPEEYVNNQPENTSRS